MCKLFEMGNVVPSFQLGFTSHCFPLELLSVFLVFRFHRFSLRFCLLCFCSSACNAHSHCELSRMQCCDSRVRLRVRRDAVRIVEDSLKANQASRGVSIQKSTNSNDELSPFFEIRMTHTLSLETTSEPSRTIFRELGRFRFDHLHFSVSHKL